MTAKSWRRVERTLNIFYFILGTAFGVSLILFALKAAPVYIPALLGTALIATIGTGIYAQSKMTSDLRRENNIPSE